MLIDKYLLKPSWLRWTTLPAILAVAAFFRFFRLDGLPPGLDLDEARGGLEAARIVAGEHPILFTTFDPREALFHYSLAPSIAALGHTVLALRIPPACWGLLTVALTFWIGCRWFGRFTGAIAALGLSLSQWHVVASRWSIHSVTVPAVVLLMLLCLWDGFDNDRWLSFLGAGAFAALGWWAYVGARILPALLAAVVAGQWLADRRSVARNGRALLGCLGACLLVLAPLAVYYAQHPEFFLWRVLDVDAVGPAAPGMEPLTIPQATLRTLGMFFVSGDPGWRTNVQGQPVFSWWLAIFFCLGVMWCTAAIARRKPVLGVEGAKLFPAAWLLTWQIIILIPAFVSRPAPHFGRTLGAAPSSYLLLALGLSISVDWCYRRRAALGGAALAGLGILLGVLGWQTFDSYFRVYQAAGQPLRDFEAGQVFDAQQLLSHQIDPAEVVLFLGYESGTSIRFLAPDYDSSVWLEDFSQMMPITARPVTYYVFGAPSLQPNAALLPYFPGARPFAQKDFPDGQPAARIYRISQAEIEAFQGAARQVGASFGDQVALESVSVGPREVAVRPGEMVSLGMTWQILRTSDQNYAAFVHVVDTQGKVVTQDDHQAMATFGWKPGQRFLSLQRITLSPDLKPGTYIVLAGMDRRSSDRQPSHSLGELGPQVPVLVLHVS